MPQKSTKLAAFSDPVAEKNSLWVRGAKQTDGRQSGRLHLNSALPYRVQRSTSDQTCPSQSKRMSFFTEQEIASGSKREGSHFMSHKATLQRLPVRRRRRALKAADVTVLPRYRRSLTLRGRTEESIFESDQMNML